MSGRLRGATLSANGGTKSGVANIDFSDAREFDRSQGDNEMFGTPVEMKRGGSGSIEMLAGNIPSGYATGTLIATTSEVTVANGVETSVTRTVTFYDVTFNSGGAFLPGSRGSRKISFEYSYCTDYSS